VPANIDLMITLPDGKVVARRDYPMDDETRSMTDPARQADERSWVTAELSGAIEQLYARAGLEHPGDKLAHLLKLLGGGVAHTPEVLEAVVTSFAQLRSIVHGVARSMGYDVPTRGADGLTRVMRGADELPEKLRVLLERLRHSHNQAATLADTQGQILDQVKQALGLDTAQSEALSDADVPAAVARALGGPEGNPAGQVVTKLLATYRLPETLADDEVFNALQKARREETGKAVREAIEDTKKVVFDDLAERFDLPNTPTLVADVEAHFTEYKNIGDDALGKEYDRGRAEVLAELTTELSLKHIESGDEVEAILGVLTGGDQDQRRRGQLDVLEALDVDASALPAEADLAEWAARARTTWYEEDTAGLRAELDVYRGYLATVLADLGVGKPKRHEDVRNGALHPDDLATLAKAAQTAIEGLNDSRRAELRMSREAERLLDFFELPGATPAEKLADRIIEAAKKAVGLASDTAHDTAQRTVEAEIELLRTTVTASGELTQALTSLEGATIRNGVSVETLRGMLARARKVEVDRFAELAVLRSLAADVARIAGASEENQARYSSGELAAQHLANELRDVKANLRKDLRTAELDATRRILADVAVQLGNPGLAETYLPGEVADLKRASDLQLSILQGVRNVLSDLRGGLDCTSEELPGMVQHTVLSERYPVGSRAELTNGNVVVITRISEKAASIVPVEVLLEGGQRMGVRPSEIKGIERDSMSGLFEKVRPGERPGDFYTEDGRKARAFKLPEDGLADIMAKVRPPKLPMPDLEKVDEFADKLADRIETWGERVAGRINAAADRLAAEIDEAVENATRKKDGGQ